MGDTVKSPDKLRVVETIAEYEKQGLFDKDIEQDPHLEPLDLDKIDFLKKNPVNKLKSHIATFLGWRFFERSLKKKEWINGGCTGLENLNGFKGGAVVTCNHFSHYDNYAVYLALRKHFKRYRLHKIVREGNYAFKGLLGFLLRHGDTIPLGMGHRKLSKCIETVDALVKKDKKILVYPEQAMWWNYRKPRPLKPGAFMFAAKACAPVIPCFISLADSDIVGKDGFFIQIYTVHILPPIYPDKDLSLKENCDKLKDINDKLWKDCYEKVYGKKLIFDVVQQ